MSKKKPNYELLKRLTPYYYELILLTQDKISRDKVNHYYREHLPFLYGLHDPKDDSNSYKYLIPIYRVFLTLKNFFWYVLKTFPLGIVEMFFLDFFEILSFLLFYFIRKYLFFGALKGLDFRVYSFRQKHKYTTGPIFYLKSLKWPRQKWYFLLRNLPWRERVFKFFLGGPYGWLGFFYNFFWVRFLSVSGYWLLKLSVVFYLLLPTSLREEGVLWNLHKLNILEKRVKDPSLFPGYKIDMSIFLYLYLEIAVCIGIRQALQ